MIRRGMLAASACALLLASCESGSAEGLIVHLVASDDGFESAVVVVDPSGEMVHRIEVPDPGPEMVEKPGGKLLLKADDGLFLIDPSAGDARKLDVPPEIAQDLNLDSFLFGSSETHTVIASARGDVAFLVDLDGGDVTDLRGIDEAIEFFGAARWSSDGAYLLLVTGSGFWLVETADPESARQIGDFPEPTFASLSADGSTVAYATDEGTDVVVENPDGSDRETVLQGDELVFSHLVPDGSRLIIERPQDRISLLPIDDGDERELVSDPRGQLTPFFDPGGDHALLFFGGDEPASHWVELDGGDATPVDELNGYFPAEFPDPDQRWMVFVDDVNAGPGRSFVSVDLNTGETHELVDLGDDELYLGTIKSSDGRISLVTTEVGDEVRARALDADTGEVHDLGSLGRSAGGDISPDGERVVLGSGVGEDATLTVRPVDGGEGVELGPGIFPAWMEP